jgi:hypothetical protein
MCKAQAAKEAGEADGGAVTTASQAYLNAQALNTGQLVAKLDGYYGPSPNRSTTIHDACTDQVKGMTPTEPVEAEPTGTGVTQTNRPPQGHHHALGQLRGGRRRAG